MGVMDAIAAIIMWIMHYRWRKHVKLLSKDYDDSVVEVSDFTVYLTGLPATLAEADVEEEVVKYINHRYTGAAQKLAEDRRANGDTQEYPEQLVASVYPVSTNGKIIKLFKIQNILQRNLV